MRTAVRSSVAGQNARCLRAQRCVVYHGIQRHVWVPAYRFDGGGGQGVAGRFSSGEL